MESKSLNLRQMRSLNKIGDCVLPGDGEFPSFSKSQCVELVDHALCNVSAQDLGDLRMLLTVLSFFPKFCIHLILLLLNNIPGSLPRMAYFGLRSLVISLYYSGLKGPAHKIIGYDVSVATD